MNAKMADDAGEEDFGPVVFRIDRSVPGVFVARVTGHGGDAEEAARRWRYFVQAARAAGKSRLMVARDLDGPVLSEAELARMVAMLAGLDMDGLRIAIVQPHLERQRIDELGAQLVMEQGCVASMFENEPSALIWLRHGG